MFVSLRLLLEGRFENQDRIPFDRPNIDEAGSNG